MIARDTGRSLRLWVGAAVLQSPQTLNGVVVDEDQRPVSDCWVWVSNPIYAGYFENNPVFAESLAAGKPPRKWDFTVTDAEGRFSVVGVAGHSYQIAALDRGTLARGHAVGTVDDPSIRVVVSSSDLHTLTVTVVDRSKRPVVGATVWHYLETTRINANGPGQSPRYVGPPSHPLSGETTDAEGRAQLHGWADRPMELRIRGTDIEALEVSVAPEDFAAGQLTAEVTRTTEVLVSVTTPQLGDQVAFLTADERECTVWMTRGGGGRTGTYHAPLTGVDLVLRVNVDARFAVLLRNGQKIRTPVQLTPSTLNRITL